ncbi:hypothetical protein CAAN1_24S01310 [[Candida] anglica]|uniref:SP-RING-type domain-containing protein n=1 Tax=[Candida] anglica TaxID=148631 RepID=A0ABP0EI68_9ASCO
MTPVLRKRHTRSTSQTVSVSRDEGPGTKVFRVVIRLPPEELEEIRREEIRRNGSPRDGGEDLTSDDFDSDDLLSLDYELNKALNGGDENEENEEEKSEEKGEENEEKSEENVEEKKIVEKKDEEKTVEEPNLGIPTQPDEKIEQSVGNSPALSTTTLSNQSKTNPHTPNVPSKESEDGDYRTIPPNLIATIRSELTDDDSLGIISKMIFTLKDPLSATKISLPVKSSACHHFECFDYDTFCTFNKIPLGIKTITRKDLAKRNFEMKRLEKERQQRANSGGLGANAGFSFVPPPPSVNKTYPQIFIPGPGPGPGMAGHGMGRGTDNKSKLSSYYGPRLTYKCPICDTAFDLRMMMISDAYNFFVKTTPRDVSRVELVDMVKYRILDDRPNSSRQSSAIVEEVIILDDDDEEDYDEEEDKQDKASKPAPGTSNEVPVKQEKWGSDAQYHRHVSEDVFDDGLDDELLSLGTQGKGSWEDPVTID